MIATNHNGKPFRWRRLMRKAEVAEKLCWSIRSVDRLRTVTDVDDPFPTPLEIGESNRWDMATVFAWIDRQATDIRNRTETRDFYLSMDTIEEARSWLVGITELAQILAMSPRTLLRKRNDGHIPEPMQQTGAPRWCLRQILDWIDCGCPRPANDQQSQVLRK